MTLTELKFLFEYNRKRGILVWKNPPKNKPFLRGQIAGRKEKSYYIQIRIHSKFYRAHGLIWFIENGTWPSMIDHINGDRSDNRIENLRSIDNRYNQHNTYRHRAGKLVGASWWNHGQRWKSQIKQNGKVKGLGYFDTEIEAHERYIQELKLRGLHV